MLKKIAIATTLSGMLLGGGSAMAAGEPTLLWHTAFDAGGYESFGKVFETFDGGLAGYGTNGDVLKMDANGGLEWNVRLPVLARDLIQTEDGGYLLVGDRGYIAKLDGIGQLVWQQTHVHANGVSGDLMSVQQTADGGYILNGNIAVNGNTDVLLLKTDANGNKLWEKTFGGTKSDLAGESESVRQTTDGGYIVVGTTWSYSNEQYQCNVYLIRTDANGLLKWQKTYGGPYSDLGYSVQQTRDGGFILGGKYEYNTDGDAYLVKTDMLGNLTWQRTYGGTGSDYGFDVQQTMDGGYALGGYYTFSDTDIDMYAVKTNSTGALEWQQAYGGGLREIANSIRQTSDGGYVMGGYTESFAQTNRDYYLVRLGYPTSMTETAAEGKLKTEGTVRTIPYAKSLKALAAPLAKR